MHILGSGGLRGCGRLLSGAQDRTGDNRAGYLWVCNSGPNRIRWECGRWKVHCPGIGRQSFVAGYCTDKWSSLFRR